MYRTLLIFWLIIYSLRYRTKPWNFFQLNHRYFNTRKKIFSKQELNQLVPAKWRLVQNYDGGGATHHFPLFVKPEWGQNSHGVALIQNHEELQAHRQKRCDSEIVYLLQEAAPGKREFEIFFIRDHKEPHGYAVLSVTETCNSDDGPLPVNGIHNRNCRYQDLTSSFNGRELDRLWNYLQEIGNFNVARVGVKADSSENLLQGYFHVIEVNIFLPMPLLLLDTTLTFSERHRFLRRAMRSSARLSRGLRFSGKRWPIFFLLLRAHYKVKQ